LREVRRELALAQSEAGRIVLDGRGVEHRCEARAMLDIFCSAVPSPATARAQGENCLHDSSPWFACSRTRSNAS
jgi:hypothetical protein